MHLLPFNLLITKFSVRKWYKLPVKNAKAYKLNNATVYKNIIFN